jgi:UTP:GlnB (protein PII) uridylyltransferase
MPEEIEQRAHEIVEELRADLDFELDDVIARIVRVLPEEYFKILSRQDQLRQLKALLAMGVCNLDEEIMLRGEDGRHIAVVARKNHPGLLANILKRIPSEPELIGAKIFTSTDHDFIIDLFEFRSNDSDESTTLVAQEVIMQTIETVAQKTGRPIAEVQEFVSQYDDNNRILTSPDDVSEQFLAFRDIEPSNETSVRWTEVPESDETRVTITSSDLQAKDVFQKTAEFLALRALDIEQAFLHEIPTDLNGHVTIASFLVSGAEVGEGAVSARLNSDSKSGDADRSMALQAVAAELVAYL